MGAHSAPSSGKSFRTLLENRQAEGRRFTLDDAIAVLVPVCVDLKARHDRGEKVYLHPSAIVQGADGLMMLNPSLAVMPTHPRDRAALAPELVRSNTPGDARASVFAVGAMLYEALTGTAVGPGMRRPRDVDPELPEAIETLLGKALVADPEHRPADLAALASAMHHIAPKKSAPPPQADESNLDVANGQPVDMRLSLLPPMEIQFSVAPPSVRTTNDAASVARDPTKQLAYLKARLEADVRPRYVVNKQRMDHGPFSAVELLQQIASNQFSGTDTLRDELTGVAKTIDDWEEFAPFAEHARMHRQIAQDKKDVAKVEKAEKKAGIAKFIVGGILAVSLIGVGGTWLVKKVGERKDGGDIGDDPSAIDLTGGGGLKGGKKAGGGKGGKGGPRVGGGGGGAGGASYDEALNEGSELNMNGSKTPDLTDQQLHGPMANASFISGCGAPGDMKVTVRVAVKNGHAVGVSVSTNPPNPGVAGCVDRHVRGLSWPVSGKLDSFTTAY